MCSHSSDNYQTWASNITQVSSSYLISLLSKTGAEGSNLSWLVGEECLGHHEVPPA